MKRNGEVARVPATHREGECCQKSLDVGQLAAVSDELKQHPERQQSTDAVADDLENFKGIKWGHRLHLVRRGLSGRRRKRYLNPAILPLTRDSRVWRERVRTAHTI